MLQYALPAARGRRAPGGGPGLPGDRGGGPTAVLREGPRTREPAEHPAARLAGHAKADPLADPPEHPRGGRPPRQATGRHQGGVQLGVRVHRGAARSSALSARGRHRDDHRPRDAPRDARVRARALGGVRSAAGRLSGGGRHARPRSVLHAHHLRGHGLHFRFVPRPHGRGPGGHGRQDGEPHLARAVPPPDQARVRKNVHQAAAHRQEKVHRRHLRGQDAH